MMKPKLIVLNGPCGIGKSTLAKRYGQDHPLTLQLDIDDVWAMLSHWREEKEEAGPLSKKMALEMARVNLLAGHDVVIPQIIQSIELAESFQALADSSNAEYVEILLIVDKEEAIRRFVKRGQDAGLPTGFRPGGVLETGGGEKKLAEMYDNMVAAVAGRSDIIRINPILGDIEITYAKIVESLN
jgi:adenylate kinase family enzyme